MPVEALILTPSACFLVIMEWSVPERLAPLQLQAVAATFDQASMANVTIVGNVSERLLSDNDMHAF